MSTLPRSVLESSSTRAAVPRGRTGASGWLREPLLHFVLLGGLLFAADHYALRRAGDPDLIVVGPEVDSEAVESFEEARGRRPNDEELHALHRIWLDNEVLYREGLAMQLDKGDDAIRERVIFKALSVIDANVKLPPIDEAGLREWFEKHREKYDEPARFDFEEAVLPGVASEAQVRAFVDRLNKGTPGDAEAGLRVFKDRPYASLAQSYGDEFPEALQQAPAGEWRAQSTSGGWRAIRLEVFTPPRPAQFETLRGVVLQDWKDAVAAEQRSAAVRALAGKYTIRFASRPG
jgi:hypothetical protein